MVDREVQIREGIIRARSEVVEINSISGGRMISLPPVVEVTPLVFLGSPNVVHLFLNIFLAAVALYYYSDIDPDYRPINVPTESLLEEYDFIIVGAGSAGSVLANRLTEVQNWTVLLIEAGGDETAISDTPLLIPATLNTAQDWNYTTQAQTNACLVDNEGRCRWPRGRGIGGSSAINAMFYVRGNPTDYDNWEALGNPGWGYKNILPYFLRAEDVRIPSLYSSPYHRTGGQLTVSYTPYQTPMLPAYLQAATEWGYDILDYNGAIQEGFSRAQFTIKDGSRCSAGRGYLRPIRARPNLNIALNAMASKILFNENAAYGVEFIRNNKSYIATASKEIIVSCGSINTPQLLMLSGIGPTRVLNSFGIPVVQNLPVGRNLQDHIGVPLIFKTEEETLTTISYDNLNSILEYTQNLTGPLTSPYGYEALGFVSSNYSDGYTPDIQYHIGSYVPSPQNLNLIEIIPLYLHPASRGYVTIQSTNIFTPPLMNPRYFSSSPDFDMLVQASLMAFNYTQTETLQAYNVTFYSEFYQPCSGFNPETLNFLTCVIEQFSFTIFHPVGTCRMGSASDPTTVVNPQLQVHGVQNLRVVDASVMPRLTSGNTNGPTIAIAERASDIIKMYWNETIGVLPPHLYKEI